MAARRRKKGILTGLAKPGLSKKPKKPASLVRRILSWIGGALILAVFGVMIWALLAQMLNPQVGDRAEEGVFEIVEIRENPATAVVTISGKTALVPLAEEDRGTLRVGDPLRVRYTNLPRLGIVRVDSWERVEAAPPE